VRANEVFVATEPPHAVAHANQLAGQVAARVGDGPGSELVEVDVGGARLVARVSSERAAALGLDAGRRVWLVLSAASVRGGFASASS
jgi:molybdate transport system ATP-binding protein